MTSDDRRDGQPDVDDLIDEAARSGFDATAGNPSLRSRAQGDAALAAELGVLRSLHDIGQAPAPDADVDRSVARAIASFRSPAVRDVGEATLVGDDDGPTAPTIRLSDRPAATIGPGSRSRSAPVLWGLAGLAAGVLLTVAVERWVVPPPPAQVVRVFDARPQPGITRDADQRLLTAAAEAERAGNPAAARRRYQQLAEEAPPVVAGWARLEAARLALNDLDDPSGALEDVDGIPEGERPRWRVFVDAITDRARADLPQDAPQGVDADDLP